VAERSRWSPAAIVEWAATVTLFRLFDWLPESVAYALGEGAGRLVFHLDRRHREITTENLAAAYPGRHSPVELDLLARSVFENLGRTAVDVARSSRLFTPAGESRIQVDGMETIREARTRGKGVLLLTGHFGPWELLVIAAALRYEPIHIVARPLDNPRLDDLLTALRERGGNRVIRKREAVQAILQVLRRGETVGILIDQHISEREGVVVPFFGRPASTASAPALLALRSGAAVLPAGIRREPGRGRYRITLGPEVPVRRSGDMRADLVENTARFNRAIEAMIREQPDHWFWVHRRWKTRHPLDPRYRPSESPPAEGPTGDPPESDRGRVRGDDRV
jgi:Kdo2-lipid IVA lauroyltransferase/acyltransferase